MSGIVTNTQAGNFAVNGAYVYPAPAQPATPQGPATNLIGIVGGASRGKINTPIVFSDPGSLIAAFGSKTAFTNSLVRAALNAMPEGNNFIGIRVSDGTETAATIHLKDAVAADVLVLTALDAGSDLNAATGRIDLQSGSVTADPVYRVTITAPNSNPRVYAGIVGSAPGGAYAAATFQANALAAINGTAPNSVANPDFVASAGPSTVAPVVATLVTATGGTDGTTGLTATLLMGTDGTVGRTGLYALRGLVAGGQVVLAGLSDSAQFALLDEFAEQEACMAHIALPSGTSTTQMQSTKPALKSPRVFVNMDWDYVQDAASGTQLLTDPSAAVAGIIASMPAYKDVCNKPYRGKAGVSSTERSILGALSQAEQGARQSNGVMYLTNQMPRGGGLWGLPHGLASDGSNACDTRMLNYCSVGTLQVLGPFVGEMQSANANDPTRAQALAALSAFYQALKSQGQIADFSIVLNTTNNTTTTVQQGFMIAAINVQTLSGVKYALAALQVGNTVQITSQQQVG